MTFPPILSLVLLLAVLMLGACGGGGDAPTPAQRAESDLQAAILASGGAQRLRLPDDGDYAAIPQDPRNPITASKVALGKLLFHDTMLGTVPAMGDMSNTYSCASCHNARFGFQAGVAQGIGEGGWGLLHRTVAPTADPAFVDVQPLRSPSAMNVAWQRNVLWNGQFGATASNVGTESAWTAGTPKATNLLGYQGLETQAIAGQKVHRLGAAPAVYQPMFDAAFPDWPVETRYGAEAAGLAIAAFERTLLANRAPFQRWLRGDQAAMSEVHKRGAALFFGKAGCVACHDGPPLATESFHAMGMPDLVGLRVDLDSQPEHRGRGGFTGVAEDAFRFKTPQLYNLSDSPFYGHGGNFRTLREVIVYKNRAVAANSRVPAQQLSPMFRPLGLSETEVDELTAFIAEALRDPDLARYEPTLLPTQACPINADAQSMIELGFSGP
ncbi:MAG: cytochrome-c peroxidase [Betaproteobacteria bacterium]|nr:cytochrome-c peroxidase [Betaproteobacteria bacterium]MBK8864695.1 cytochrome-c peroxidase [Betaproteobacteria bacterium]